jgi:hypothetical protein
MRVHVKILAMVASILTLAVIVAGLILPALNTPPVYNGPLTFWSYQCIDTMKSSRDQARSWAARADLTKLIDQQMTLISATGANCVAIDTPYNLEFLPVLKAWVAGARSHGLKVWFRGNFAEWEGWFNYPKGMTTSQLLDKTTVFIKANPGLFQNGDIFTAAPEAENGGPFNQVAPAQYQSYRDFLVSEQRVATSAFLKIHKQVKVNWASMNGGLAERMLDKATVNQLGKVVTIDHYIAYPDTMGQFIKHLQSTLGAKVVVGEWGGPIPDINGAMTPKQQAELVNQLLTQMALNSGAVEGVNYWTLGDGSTALVDGQMNPLPAYDALMHFYKPAVLKGTVTGVHQRRIAGATVTVDGSFITKSDRRGNYAIMVPSGAAVVTVKESGYATRSQTATLIGGMQSSLNYHLTKN